MFRRITNYLLQLELTHKSLAKYIELKQQASLIITLPDYKERKLQNIYPITHLISVRHTLFKNTSYRVMFIISFGVTFFSAHFP